MPKYLFKCSDCSMDECHDISIPEFLNLKDKRVESLSCDNSCLYSEKRAFDNISSKVYRDQHTRIEEIKEESRKIVSKVKKGDLKTIETIYGTN